MNNIKVFVLMAGLTAMPVVLGGSIGGQQGAITAFVMAAVSNFGMYFPTERDW
jgi:heat shock protein HtpX